MASSPRRLNVKLLLFLFLGAVVLGVGVHFLHGAQLRRSAGTLLAEADTAEKQGENVKAVDYLERFLSYNPNDVPTLERLGGLLAKSDNPVAKARAVQVYEKALQKDPKRDATRRALVEHMLALDQSLYSSARPHIEILLKSDPLDGRLHYLMGRCEEGNNNPKNAIDQYLQAKANARDQVDAYVRLAELYRSHEKNTGDADKTMDAMIAANPKSAAAYFARARYRAQSNKADVTEAALQDLAKALELDPDNAEILLASAMQARAKKDYATARKHLKHGIEKNPENQDLIQAAALVEIQDNHRDEAIAQLEAGVKTFPKDANLHWMLVDNLLLANKIDEAAAKLKELKELKEKLLPEVIQFAEGRIQFARGQWADAAKSLDQARGLLMARGETRGMAKIALLLLGQCQERLGNLDQALEAFRQASMIRLSTDPYEVPAQLGAAACLTALNRPDEALEVYQGVVSKEPRAGIPMARLMIYLHIRNEATNWKDVETLVDQLERALPNAPEVTLLRVEMLAAKGQNQAARALLEQSLGKQGDQVDFWVNLALLTAREPDKIADAFGVLDRAEKQLGDRVDLRIARAALWTQRRGDEAAAAIAKLENDLTAFSTDDQVRLRRALAADYSLLGKAEDAARLWELITKQLPNDRNINLTLFDQALQAGRTADAEAVLARILKAEGEDSSDWRFGRAALLVHKAQKSSPPDPALLSEARNLLDKIAAQRPSWGRVVLGLAQIDELEGNQENAISKYLKAIVELGERNPAAVTRVSLLLNAQKRYAEAGQVLQTLKNDHTPLSPDLQRLEAQLAYQNADYTQAVEQAEKLVAKDTKNFRELLWLGQIQGAAGKPGAETSFRHAVALAPDAPEAWASLLVYLARAKQTEAAEKVLADAEKALPREKAALVLAQGHEELGHEALAKQWYKTALEALPNDPITLQTVARFDLKTNQIVEAKEVLQRLSSHPDRSAAAWSRRILAQLTVIENGTKGAWNALKLLTQNDQQRSGDVSAARKGTPDDLRIRAKIKALLPNSTQRREAIAILEDLFDRQVGIPEDRFLLGQLYEAEGDWPKARDHMTKLIDTQAASPNYPAYLTSYIRALLRQNRANEAQIVLNKLEQAAPNQPGTLESKVRVLHAQNKKAEAAAILKTYAGADNVKIGLVARLFEELGLYPEAEQMYRDLAAKLHDQRPDAVVPLAAFLGRRGRTKEALDLVTDAVWKVAPAEILSNLCVQILYGADSNNPDINTLSEAVAERLKTAVKEHPDKISIQFDYGNVRCFQKRFDEAESVYREIQNQNKAIGAPLNNLAWMLALKEGGNTDEALSLIDQAIQLDGETPDLLDTRALINIVRKQPDAAIKDLEEAVKISPTKDKYFHLARAYHLANHMNDFRAAFNQALKLGLSSNDLHPMEREAYRKLSLDLNTGGRP